MHSPRLQLVRLACLLLGLALLTPSAQARVRLESICRIAGEREQKLVGLGLVVGLNGSGDGGAYLPTIKALSSALMSLNNPLDEKTPLKDSKNVAIVLIEATVPATGIRRGEKIDCFVNSIGAAKSLKGGRLMISPLQGADRRDPRAMGLASGAVTIEDEKIPTSGRIPLGVIIEQNMEDFSTLFIQNESFTLLLDASHSSFSAANDVARAINADTSFLANKQQVAKAQGPGVVKVTVPEQYQDDPVDFVAQVLAVGIDNPTSQARVVINERTKTVVITGEVELSPVAVAHKGLSITVGDPAAAPEDGNSGRFVPLMEDNRQTASQSFQELYKALNQLKVPEEDVIDIIKELHRSGKLHAVLITE